MTNYYLDPVNGDNSNSGESVDDAFADFNPIAAGGSHELGAGDSLFIRGAKETAPIDDYCDLYRQGSENGEEMYIGPYEDENPVIDRQGGADHAMAARGTYNLTIKGLEIRNTNNNAIEVNGAGGTGAKNNTFQNLHVHDYALGGSAGDGIQISDSDVTDTTVRGCSFHDAFAGGSSDGINASGGSKDLLVEDCNFYYLADDGIDTNDADGEATKEIRRCLAWRIGYDRSLNNVGDGNGFKINGGTGSATGTVTVTRCASFLNRNRGFKNNSSSNEISHVYNCTAWDNGGDGFQIRSGENTHYVKNCIAYQNATAEDNGVYTEEEANTWNLGITDPQFRSMATGIDDRPANDDFLRLVESSPCVDAGVKPGSVRYRGEAPDLGAFEYGGIVPKGATPRQKKVWTGSRWVTVP